MEIKHTFFFLARKVGVLHKQTKNDFEHTLAYFRSLKKSASILYSLSTTTRRALQMGIIICTR
jgi:hypothetical protein